MTARWCDALHIDERFQHQGGILDLEREDSTSALKFFAEVTIFNGFVLLLLMDCVNLQCLY